MSDQKSAIVIKSTGSWYTLCDLESGEWIECRLKGRMRLEESRSTNPIVVGDRVDYQLEERAEIPLEARSDNHPASKKSKKNSSKEHPAPGTGKTGVITQLHERHNYIIRRASNLSKSSHIIAANIDQAFLVATIAFPTTSNEFIDRFLVTAEAYHIPTTIVLNKTDLYTTPELQSAREEFIATYTLAGYPILEVVAQEGTGVDALRTLLHNRTSLLSGNSGVGKSTLIRAIDPSLNPRVGAISDYHNRGKHTTTFSEMYPLEGGGYLIDTPGIKGFGLFGLEAEEICRYFPDLFKYSVGCSFHNCTHTHEPDCAVKDALEEGLISFSRYESYLKILDDDTKYR